MATNLPLKIAVINIAGNGDNTVVSAPASGGIEIYQIAFTSAGAVNVVFKNGSTAQSGAYILTQNGSSLFFPYTGVPWSVADAGANWVINLSGAVALTGQVFYKLGG